MREEETLRLCPAITAMFNPAVLMHQKSTAAVRFEPVINRPSTHAANWVRWFWVRNIWPFTHHHAEETWVGVRWDISRAHIGN